MGGLWKWREILWVPLGHRKTVLPLLGACPRQCSRHAPPSRPRAKQSAPRNGRAGKTMALPFLSADSPCFRDGTRRVPTTMKRPALRNGRAITSPLRASRGTSGEGKHLHPPAQREGRALRPGEGLAAGRSCWNTRSPPRERLRVFRRELFAIMRAGFTPTRPPPIRRHTPPCSGSKFLFWPWFKELPSSCPSARPAT